jgi:hypothetical protein
MAQLVFELWAPDLHSVLSAVRMSLKGKETSFYVMFSDTQEYRETSQNIATIIEKMLSGEIISFSMRPSNGNIRYGLVNGPFFAGWPRGGWFGTVEYLDDNYEPLWRALLSNAGLRVVSIGLDEGVGGLSSPLTDEMMSVDTFPWSDRYLIMGAIRTGEGWAIRKGPRYYSPQNGRQ